MDSYAVVFDYTSPHSEKTAELLAARLGSRSERAVRIIGTDNLFRSVSRELQNGGGVVCHVVALNDKGVACGVHVRIDSGRTLYDYFGPCSTYDALLDELEQRLSCMLEDRAALAKDSQSGPRRLTTMGSETYGHGKHPPARDTRWREASET